MSMLTAQCQKLRDTASALRENYTFVGFDGMTNRDPTIFSAAQQMDEAADTIENLRMLWVENAKLRMRVARVWGVAERLCRAFPGSCDSSEPDSCPIGEHSEDCVCGQLERDMQEI